jgi:membrane-associated phospholipid phosphatase
MMKQKSGNRIGKRSRSFCLLLLFLLPLALKAQPASIDTLRAIHKPEPESRVKWIVPAAITVSGVLSAVDYSWINRKGVQRWRDRQFPGFTTRADDFIWALPIASAYLLDWSGVPAKTDFANRTAILIKAELMMVAVVYPLKALTSVKRPDASGNHSFPSMHTAQAFVAANFLRHEYGGRSVWYSIAGYTVATGVGALRVLNNKHWISDVLAGAGIGMLCSELAYHTHKYKWGKGNKIAALPYMGRGQAGLYVRVGL